MGARRFWNSAKLHVLMLVAYSEAVLEIEGFDKIPDDPRSILAHEHRRRTTSTRRRIKSSLRTAIEPDPSRLVDLVEIFR